MSQLNDLPHAVLQFYVTAPYPCSYLPGKMARSQVATPSHLIGNDLYAELVRLGFRRSGIFTYRPYCDACRACVPVRHAGARVRDLALPAPRDPQARPASPPPRSACGSASSTTRSISATRRRATPAAAWTRTAAISTRTSCCRAGSNTRLVEFRDDVEAGDGEHRRLPVRRPVVGLHLLRPELEGASLGTFNILWQIEQCRALGLPYLYLGYWIRDSRKMAYKARFRPIEGLVDGMWRRLADGEIGG